ncbi:unnamed protein product [Arabidopsis halleri]
MEIVGDSNYFNFVDFIRLGMVFITMILLDGALLDDNDEDLVGGEESGKESDKDESVCVER